MSLILDALNRSRREDEEMPGIFSSHTVDHGPAGHSWTQWLLVGALALAVLAIGALLIDRLPQQTAAVDNPVVKSAPEAPAQVADLPTAQAPVDARSIPVESAQSAAMTPPSTPAAQPARQAEPAVAQVPAGAVPAGSPSPPAASRAPADARVAELYQQQARGMVEPAAARSQKQTSVAAQGARSATSGGASREEEAIDIDELVQKARAELGNKRLTQHAVPFLADLSQQFKDTVPSIMYLKHDYSTNPSVSSVYINGKTLGAGSSVGGIKVEEILPDSVVLEYKGDRFRLRALNSWVNM
ncbi:MAG: general secretion pathway protein GspB [Halioglobus sp.]|nr:general secretion pathway protein GspB [Halioglobus sp.]